MRTRFNTPIIAAAAIRPVELLEELLWESVWALETPEPETEYFN